MTRPPLLPALLAALLLTPALSGCDAPAPTPEPEAVSLLGEPLHRPQLTDETRERLEAQLAEARADLEANPGDADAIIWVGRRLAYPGRYQEAVEVFSEGIRLHPEDARMYRHRGHRYITLRRLDDAIRDLERAAELTLGEPDEIEPDGMPNPYGIPTSTLQSNIWYHLALARYLKHDFEGALEAWRECMEVSTNNDMRVATADWLYMTLRRLGRDAEAVEVLEPFHADMEILENDAYHRRLLMYRGELTPEELLAVDDQDPVQVATYGYGVANWYLYNGEEERAFQLFRRILEGTNWAAFGYIAAEAELAHRR
jgi:tetratricopeptide (TPR) repeat protein